MNLSIFLPLFGVVIFISTLKCQWHLVRRSEDPFSALFPGQRVSIWKMREKCGQPVVWLDGWMAGWVDGMGSDGGAQTSSLTAWHSYFFHTFFRRPRSALWLLDGAANWQIGGNGKMGLENIKVVVKNVLDTCLRRHIRALYFQGATVSRLSWLSKRVEQAVWLTKYFHYNIEYCYRERYTSYKN